MTIRIHAVNSTDKDWTTARFLLAFGATGSVLCLAWANSLEDALDVSIDYLEEKAPSLFCDTEVNAMYDAVRAKGMTEEAAYELASQDIITGGNYGRSLHSWEVNLLATNPTRATLLQYRDR